MPDSAYDIVERFWPYDGPYSTDTIHTAAGALSGLVRYLNNATGPAGNRLQYAQDVDRIVANLQGAVGALPQLLTQLRRFINRQADKEMLYDDRARDDHERATLTALELSSALVAATTAVQVAYARLNDVRRCSNRLGNREHPARPDTATDTS